MGTVVIIFILLAILDSADSARRDRNRRDRQRRIREDEEETDRMANELRLEKDRKKMMDNISGKSGKKEHI
jgi:hypothetical protein